MSPTRRREPQPPARRRAGRVVSRVGALALLALTATACTSEELARLGMPEPITVQAERVLNLWQGSWVAAFAVGALVWGLIIWAVIFHRKRSDDLPPQVRYNLPIEAIYTIVPFVVIAVLFYFTARDQNELNKVSDNPDLRVNVTAFQWSWEFEYPDHQGVVVKGRTGGKPTLVLPTDRTVQFHLRSREGDVIHSFWVPAFLYKRDVIPGHPNTFEVTPKKEGTYAGRCAELCGTYHSQMLFDVRVVSPQEFQQFIDNQQTANQQAAGQQPANQQAAGSAQ